MLRIIKSLAVEAVEITAPGLDPIQVTWHDMGPSQGRVTLSCYGCAWTAYFGGMGGHTIRQFFASADTGYLTTKLGITPYLKRTKRHDAYLGRIIDGVKASLEVEAAAGPEVRG